MTDSLLQQKAEKADQLSQAEDAILAAFQVYSETLAAGPLLDPSELLYRSGSAPDNEHKFNLEPVGVHRRFAYDGVFAHATESEAPLAHQLLLSLSPHWEDRIRAVALQRFLRDEITMPNGFPCIYEPANSPRNAEALNPKPFVWVASPDEAMLHELLPLYRELWDSYEAQWSHTPNRTFEVGRLNRVAASGVYRPGTTPVDVISQTMLTHSDMYRTAPDHLRQMHPFHTTRVASRAGATANW
jgi:hypothetical protein